MNESFTILCVIYSGSTNCVKYSEMLLWTSQQKRPRF